jgi:glycosyltransferase involved in cell wall biosynthesis
MALAIAKHNPWMDALVVPANVIGTLLYENGKLPFDIDCVHIFSEWDAMRLAPNFQGKVPVINAVHHVELWSNYAPLLAGDAVQVVAHQWLDFIKAQGAAEDQLVLLPNGIDTDMFTPLPAVKRDRLRATLGIPKNGHAIGMFAKRSSDVTGRKAPHVFIEGITRLATEFANVTAVIVGPGWADVVQGLEAKGVTCVYKPFIPDRQGVAEVCQALDTYWVTSRIEGGPVPLLETMSCGVCCIATPVGVVPELLREGENGFVVAFDDVDAFVAKTKPLITNASLWQRISQAGRQTIVDNIQWKDTAKQAVPLYTAAMKRFAQAKGIPIPYDVAAAAATFVEPERTARADIPRKLIRRMQSLEQYTWFQELLNMNERSTAIGFAARAMLNAPTDFELCSMMLRNLLPKKMVKLLSRNRQMPRSQEASTVATTTG